VSVELDDVGEIDPLDRLRASMELVAPRVALSVRVSAAIGSTLDEPAWARLFEAAHRVHAVVSGPPDPASTATLDRLLRLSQSSRAAVLVEASSRRGSTRDAIGLALEAARRAVGSGARALLTLDPALDLTPLFAYRKLAADLATGSLSIPIVLLDRPNVRGVDEVLGTASALGGLLCQGIGDAVHVETQAAEDARRLGFNILQAARVRMTKTEFISCPSCGRTLFDLETTTAEIKARTSHLKGLKIAVMGCIVNGPGEMADADFGYVGWGDDKIALFVGKELVAKDIPTRDAADRLVELIQKHGRWVDPGVAVANPD
jgi:(E)-4-hydroxy-3-methylbut-2-enyl-diphosphate synthase